MLLYGAGLAPWFRDAGTGVRLLLAVPIVDQLYLTAVARFERGDLDERGRRLFYLGAALHLVVAWVAAQTVGVLAGDELPGWAGLHMASPLVLTGMLATAARSPAAGTAAAVAAATAVVGADLPHHSVVVVAIAVGVAAASVRRLS